MNKIVESERQRLRQPHLFIRLINFSHPEAERRNDKLQLGRSRTENSLLSTTETIPKLSRLRVLTSEKAMRARAVKDRLTLMASANLLVLSM